MSKEHKAVVAIDGPAGAGKSSAAKLLAQKLGFVLVDTGALYRGVAWAAGRKHLDLDDSLALGALARELEFAFHTKHDGSSALWVDGRDCSNEIRTQAMAQAASDVSTYPEVRDALLSVQRRLGQGGGVVLEGRDIGTVVFPDADVKVFLTASLEARAQRRHKELIARGADSAYEAVLEEIRQRDAQDMGREVAPLVPAKDATVMDSTALELEEVVERLYRLVKERSGS
ncbi:MAG: (d)CMP kinase [Myxococcales bacterium]|nr:(d)CMP kinase [Myxococcales bacterium]MCB9708553.1 (d)CMP kinase [Myxococcales bacterium]